MWCHYQHLQIYDITTNTSTKRYVLFRDSCNGMALEEVDERVEFEYRRCN